MDEPIRVGDARRIHELSNANRDTRSSRLVDMLLFWVLPYIVKGYRQPLDELDVPKNPPRDQAKELTMRAKELWKKEVEKKGPLKASLISGVILPLQKFEIIAGITLSVVQGILFSVARPILLGMLIDVVVDGSGAQGFRLVAIFAASVFLENLVEAMAKQILACTMGIRFFTWISGLIQDKVTRVSSGAVAESKLQEASLLGGDVTRMVEDWRFLCLFVYVCVAFVGGVSILAITLGLSSLVGFSIMLCVLVCNVCVSVKVKTVVQKDATLCDERIATLRETIDGIKAIKMMAWEMSFEEILFKLRKEETRYIRVAHKMMIGSVNFARASPVLASCFSILTLALLEPEKLNASTIFVSITAFQGLRLPLIALSQHATLAAKTYVSLNRIARFLNLEDATKVDHLDTSSGYSCVVKDGSFSWGAQTSNSDFKLCDITFNVKSRNNLVAVVGRVGSGKSTLVSSLLGVTKALSGTRSIVDNVAVVPQSAFVMSGTVIENVIMGHKFDKDLFSAVLHASALDVDLKALANGADTEIGERGQTLSGGQMARVSIARALYHQPDLLILDDPLSAVDPEVANNLFRRSILAFVGRFGSVYGDSQPADSNRSVIMTLNQLQFLPYFDHIVVLKNGTIVEQGTYNDLIKRGGVLSEMTDGVEITPDDDDLENFRLKDMEELGQQSDDVDEKKVQAVLVAADYAETGAVKSSVFWGYATAMGLWRLPVSCVLGLFTYSMMAAGDLSLAFWIRDAQELASSEHLRRAGIYIMFAILNVIGAQSLSMHNANSSSKASRSVHNKCIDDLLHAPISFFEATPSGRIVSRFSGDLAMVDRMLAFMYDDFFQMSCLLLALLVIVVYIVPELLYVLLIGLSIFVYQVIAVDRTNREVKRFANQSLSPILTNVSETIGARDLMHSMKLEDFFRNRHFQHVDRYSSNRYLGLSILNFSVLVAGLLNFSISTTAAVVVVVQREDYEPAFVGLALTYSFLLPYFLSALALIVPEFINTLTSLERVLEYRKVEKEAAWETEQDTHLRESSLGWPSCGEIKFVNVSFRYRPELPLALKNVSFSISPGAAHALVGRSGSGKSTVTLCLFRVHEIFQGQILIDQQDISQIGLQLLRQRLTIIPQTPLLLRGTLRNNLDPFNEYTDQQLEAAMLKVGLDIALLHQNTLKNETTKKKKKKSKVFIKDEDKIALSVGERQLLSLARATLRPAIARRIVILDEPTSSLDRESDDHIQAVVRREFANATTITIAHRISSIIDSDSITVMDAGQVSEHGTPAELLANPDGIFFSMVQAMGSTTARNLSDLANAASSRTKQ